MGRKRIDPKFQRKIYGISLREDEKKDLENLASNLGMTGSETIRYLIQEAKKNQTWKNIIRNLYEVDRRNKALEAWEKTHPAKCTNYKTVGSCYTSLHTVDQHQDDNTIHEEVSNEEIEQLLDDYYKGLEEERNKKCVHVTDR